MCDIIQLLSISIFAIAWYGCGCLLYSYTSVKAMYLSMWICGQFWDSEDTKTTRNLQPAMSALISLSLLSGKMGKYRTDTGYQKSLFFFSWLFPQFISAGRHPISFFCLDFEFTPMMSIDWIVNDLLHYYDHHEKTRQWQTQSLFTGRARATLWSSFLIVGHLPERLFPIMICRLPYELLWLHDVLGGSFKYMYMSGNIYLLFCPFQLCITRYSFQKKSVSVLLFPICSAATKLCTFLTSLGRYTCSSVLQGTFVSLEWLKLAPLACKFQCLPSCLKKRMLPLPLPPQDNVLGQHARSVGGENSDAIDSHNVVTVSKPGSCVLRRVSGLLEDQRRVISKPWRAE